MSIFENYNDPISVTIGDIKHELENNLEEQIYTAVINTGIKVDKEQLIKALAYDRQQYEAGYYDGYKKAIVDLRQVMYDSLGKLMDELLINT